MIDDEVRNTVWKKGRPVEGYSPDLVRKDVCGAYMIKKYTNRENMYAWEIDHIIPKVILDQYNVPKDLQDSLINLRPLNFLNNISKADDIPIYNVSCIAVDKTNVKTSKMIRVLTPILQNILEFYKSHGYDIKL